MRYVETNVKIPKVQLNGVACSGRWEEAERCAMTYEDLLSRSDGRARGEIEWKQQMSDRQLSGKWVPFSGALGVGMRCVLARAFLLMIQG